MHHYVPQVTVQPSGSSSYQQQAHANVNGQSQQTSDQLYSQYSQQNVMQNSLSRAASYAPFGVRSAVRTQQSGYDNHSRPMDPTQEQSRLLSQQEPLHYGSIGSNQGQQYTTTSLQTIPTQAPALSSHTVHMTRPPKQYAQQSSSIQNVYPGAVVSQTQATASGSTYPQDPPPHTTMNMAQPQVTVVASSSSVSTAY